MPSDKLKSTDKSYVNYLPKTHAEVLKKKNVCDLVNVCNNHKKFILEKARTC